MQLLRDYAIPVQGHHLALSDQPFITMKLRFAAIVFQPRRHLELSCRAGLLTLARHSIIETGLVNQDAVLAADVLRQIKREAVGVM